MARSYEEQRLSFFVREADALGNEELVTGPTIVWIHDEFVIKGKVRFPYMAGPWIGVIRLKPIGLNSVVYPSWRYDARVSYLSRPKSLLHNG
jgi:hypothetical protein